MSRRLIAVLFAVSLGAACASTQPSDSAAGSSSTTAASASDQTPDDAEPDALTSEQAEGGSPDGAGAEAAVAEAAPDPEAAACEPTGPQGTQTVETSQFDVTDAARPVKHPVLVLRDLQLCQGQPRLLSGHHVATVTVNMLWGVDIRCTPDGDPGNATQQSLRRSVLSTRNHGGSGQQELGVRWVFVPDRSGTYDCELRAWGKIPSTVDGDHHMTVVPGSDTGLSLSGVEAGATEWREADDAYLCWDPPDDDDPDCNRSDTVLDNQGMRFTAADDATSIDVYAGVEASICAAGYSECTDGTAGTGDFTIRTRLIATQLASEGTNQLCPGAQAHVRDETTPVPGAGALNHTKIHLDIDRPVPVVASPDCSRSFAIRVLVDYVRTNPETPNHGGLVEGMIPDGDPADAESLNRYYTSAYATNNYTSTSTPNNYTNTHS